MTRRVPVWLRCSQCYRIARPGKIVSGIVRAEDTVVGQSKSHTGRVCATGDCEARWRAIWDTARTTPTLEERPDATEASAPPTTEPVDHGVVPEVQEPGLPDDPNDGQGEHRPVPVVRVADEPDEAGPPSRPAVAGAGERVAGSDVHAAGAAVRPDGGRKVITHVFVSAKRKEAKTVRERFKRRIDPSDAVVLVTDAKHLVGVVAGATSVVERLDAVKVYLCRGYGLLPGVRGHLERLAASGAQIVDEHDRDASKDFPPRQPPAPPPPPPARRVVVEYQGLPDEINCAWCGIEIRPIDGLCSTCGPMLRSATKVAAAAEGLRDVFDNLSGRAATQSRDTGAHSFDAAVYAVLVGWGDSLDEVGDVHGWGPEYRQRLAAGRAAMCSLMGWSDDEKGEHHA